MNDTRQQLIDAGLLRPSQPKPHSEVTPTTSKATLLLDEAGRQAVSRRVPETSGSHDHGGSLRDSIADGLRQLAEQRRANQ